MAKNKKRNRTSDAVEIMDRRYFEGRPEMLVLLERERVNADVAQKVYDLRLAAGLTQRELAKQVGTTPSVICRLEDANYDGHSLTMLQRIAAAVGNRVEVNFVPATSSPANGIRDGRGSPSVKEKRGRGAKRRTKSKHAQRTATKSE